MARYTGPVCKKCRAEGQKLFLKGERCYTNKCSVGKRAYPPGQHGQARKKLSEYAIHLREKQKVRTTYLVLEKQFARYFEQAERKKGVTGTILLQILESRFDNVMYQSGLVSSRKQARQLIRHGHFLIKGRKVNVPSYRLKPGDEITVKQKSQKLVKEVIETQTVTPQPRWLSVDKEALKVRVESLPEREDLSPDIKEHLIIEHYSK